jgi:thioredoxin reductase (NADPH)
MVRMTAPQGISSELPLLTAGQMAVLTRHATRCETTAGQVLYAAGDRGFDFIVIEAGEVDVVLPAMPDAPENVIVTWGPGLFLGELNLLTGQTAIATARVRAPGVVHRLPPAQFRELMAADAELSDLIVWTLLARRESLRRGEAARTLEILGSQLSPAAHALRTWAARQELPHLWLDIDTHEGQALAGAMEVTAADLPTVITPTRVLRQATAGDVAGYLGLALRPEDSHDYVVVVVGGGPAGLAAAVYGSSEGLSTMLLDSIAVGGQAAASARIENYLGFPSGLTGIELTSRALVQANKFGAHVSTPCGVVGLDCQDGDLHLALSNGEVLDARAVVIATGARYRKLPLDRWSDFEGAGIYYAATDIEARGCAGQRVTVLGGANSAGQAALFLAESGGEVDLVARAADVSAEMSYYLVERLLAHPAITVHTATQVTALHGDGALDAVTLTSANGGEKRTQCGGLFCFIGAEPATDWLTGVGLDEDGFIRTDRDLTSAELGTSWDLLGRAPLPFETNIPGVFAAGDVRAGSMKRVAAAVGEGASAIRSVHLSLAQARR